MDDLNNAWRPYSGAQNIGGRLSIASMHFAPILDTPYNSLDTLVVMLYSHHITGPHLVGPGLVTQLEFSTEEIIRHVHLQ